MPRCHLLGGFCIPFHHEINNFSNNEEEPEIFAKENGYYAVLHLLKNDTKQYSVLVFVSKREAKGPKSPHCFLLPSTVYSIYRGCALWHLFIRRTFNIL